MAETTGVYTTLDELTRLRHQATGFSFLPRQPITSALAGRHASRLRGRGLNFEELRHYLPGDDIRTIDWRVTQRLREPYVRVYTEERDRPAILVVDQRLSMFFGSELKMKSVTAAEAAALAAWRVLAMGDRVGAVIFDDQDLTAIRPHRSDANVLRILGEIVRRNRKLSSTADAARSPAMFQRVLERVARLAKHDCLVALITDGDGADEDAVRLVTQLSEHNDVITLFVYDRLETQLPDAGTLVAAEGELQLELDSSNKKLREGFARQFSERLAWIQKISRQREIALLPVHTAEGVAEQARRLLGNRSRTAGGA